MQLAAIELFAEQGFEKTTVTEIAARAGVTRRTFFRHFPDKREVLFSGSVTDLPETALVEGIARADGDLMPLQMIASAIAGYDWARKARQAAVGASAAGRPAEPLMCTAPGLAPARRVALAFTMSSSSRFRLSGRRARGGLGLLGVSAGRRGGRRGRRRTGPR